MKTIKQIVTVLCFILINVAFAQEAPVTAQKNELKFSVYGGYDFPKYDTDFKYIDYDGGLMGGFSINKYWGWFGLQADVNYIQNKPIGTLESVMYDDFNSGVTSYNIDYQKDNITRIFYGIGPSFQLYSKNQKFSFEAAALVGYGTVKGGEIMGTFTDNSGTKNLVSYHSGYDHSGFAVKGSLKANYWFNDNWGVFAGAYYMNHFKIDEATDNKILNSNSFYTSGTGLYYAEPG